jgi:RNA polymerase sigma-70 factor (ECF subfamily)
MAPPGEITRLIVEWQRGSKDAENALYDALYKRLHSIALNYLRSERPNPSMGATALVHEAYLRFRRSERLEIADSSHFLKLSARVMRQILVDRARALGAAKRQGEVHAEHDHLDMLVSKDSDAEEIIAVDRALQSLARRSPRQAELVELRYFAEFSEEEAGAILGISARTVRREWQVAKTRLRAEIDGASPASE